MKKTRLAFTLLVLAFHLQAQSNGPVRLALVSAADEAAPAVDLLTAQLSGDARIQLLERDEIARVYHEQGLSAGNGDYLKLGQVLGADGLLMLQVVRTRTSTNLLAHLIAVKPGVVLTEGSFPWPLTEPTAWSGLVTSYIGSFLPKLAVLPKDAIPISVVNLRSATQSADTLETERELKMLAIQRLSQERQFFVLERQHLQRLAGEKELKSDDSPFWSGAYLLEGVVDQNGYSPDKLTIDARLTPSKGGAALSFMVSGSRTNYSEVINALADKVAKLLKVKPSGKEWSAGDEAKQFYDEATWALRWGVYPEAQAAADSAWALGKRDMDCVTAQVQAYELHATDYSLFQPGGATNPLGTNSLARGVAEDAAPETPHGLIWRAEISARYTNYDYVYARKLPNPEDINASIHALELYYAFSQTLPAGEPKVDSGWYLLGIEDLTYASRVLQQFNFIPPSQPPAGERLADLRKLARSVVAWISRSPSVHDGYFVGDRTATYDELNHFRDQPSIFNCAVNWGCFWQDRPGEAIALYRELMASPVFGYIHNDFWIRELQKPRLAAWSDDDRRRLQTVWDNFLGELEGSTNLLWQLEGRALALADANTDSKLSVTFTNLFEDMLAHRDELVANNVDLSYLNWGTDDLVEAKIVNGVVSDTKNSLQQLFSSNYRPKLEAMGQEYRNKTLPVVLFRPVFERQKAYLRNNAPYDFFGFVDLFQTPHVVTSPSGNSSELVPANQYTKDQALEILPLISAYKSNLVALADKATGMDQGKLKGGISQVDFLAQQVNSILNPAPPRALVSNAVPVVRAPVTPPAPTVPDDVASNVVRADRFFAIPLDSITRLHKFDRVKSSTVVVTGHHWAEERLVLDFNYSILVNVFDQSGTLLDNPVLSGDAIAVLDPAAGHWDVVTCPEVEITAQNLFYHRTALWQGNLYHCDSGHIKKYDFQAQQWQVPGALDTGNCELFAINGHLYAANREMILEIVDGGNGTRLLASNRRQPPVTALDRENLGTPILFAGPDQSLRVSTGSKIFTRTGTDWREDSVTPASTGPPAAFEDGTVFRQMENGPGQSPNISFLPTGAIQATLCLQGPSPAPQNNRPPGAWPPQANPAPVPAPAARWKMPPGFSLPKLPAAPRGSDFFLIVDHSGVSNIIDQHQNVILGKTVLPRDGYNAELLCFSGDLPRPQKVFLKFDAGNGCPPVAGIDPKANEVMPADPPGWMLCTSNYMLCGFEKPAGSFPGPAYDMGMGCQAGAWLIPLAQIDAATAAQKQTQAAEIAHAQAAAEKVRQEADQALKNLIAKYDRNHNGIIDPDEREGALDDPAFIESQLDAIDTNHNSWLDASELVYFDANSNKVLDPKELAGINLAGHLFAVSLMKKYDSDGDGFLDRSEFENLYRSAFSGGTPRSFPPMAGRMYPDSNRDGHVDLGELESFLVQQTRRGLRPVGPPDAARLGQLMANGAPAPNRDQIFKAEVEYYWQHPEAFRRGAPLNGRPGAGAVINAAPGGPGQ